ncbi:MAG: bacillithiol system redox-active protein YtxJ [Anaerolineae bacterium]|nr:bacillithiol system redox-active protein YtxJ [Anaerolineae bacterium]
MIHDVDTKQDYNRLVQASHDKPVLLLKHSTRCPISASRWREFQEFAKSDSRADFYRVLVIENKALSQHIAQATTVSHASPQVLLFHKGQVTWHRSHWSITPESMSDALGEARG